MDVDYLDMGTWRGGYVIEKVYPYMVQVNVLGKKWISVSRLFAEGASYCSVFLVSIHFVVYFEIQSR